MTSIKDINKIQANYPDWRPADIAFIKELEWSGGNLRFKALCQIRKSVKQWPDLSQPFFEITILFENINMLKLAFAGGSIQQITGFDIIDNSNSGWENINFRIEDYENGIIEFNCETITIQSVSNPEIINVG